MSSVINKFSETIWKKQEQEFKALENSLKIPNFKLQQVDSVILRRKKDIDKIPDGGGCYWIWSDEPVKHVLHKKDLPERFNGGEVVYNGISQDNVKGRIEHHLFGLPDAGWSGISMDIYTKESTSHRKRAMSLKSKDKVPYVFTKGANKDNKKRGEEIEYLTPIRNKELLLTLTLSKGEKAYIKNTRYQKYFFRNGIDIAENKHKEYTFTVYYIVGLESLYLEYIEKKWRKIYGQPRLCSYVSGR